MPETAAFYETLAKGGVGTIISGMVSVSDTGCSRPDNIRAYDATFADRLRPLVDLAHRHNTRFVVQLVHSGKKGTPDDPEKAPFAPSYRQGKPYREPSKEDIRAITHDFAAAALQCKAAGADGIQLHGAHGYLLSQFLCPALNSRTDEYGGSIENRARFLFEVYDAVRAAVGPEYPIWIKLNSTDGMENGLTFEESLWICKELDRRGINAIEVSGGGNAKTCTPVAPVREKADEAYFAQAALAIGREVSADIISVGGYREPETAERVLNQGNVAAISLSRPLICEPDIIARWQAGQRDRAKCVSCNRCFSLGFLSCKTFPQQS